MKTARVMPLYTGSRGEKLDRGSKSPEQSEGERERSLYKTPGRKVLREARVGTPCTMLGTGTAGS